MPTRLASWACVQSARRAHRFLRRAGVPPGVRYRRLHLPPMRHLAVPRSRFEGLLEAEGRCVVMVDTRQRPAMLSCTYVARRPAA